MDKGFVFGKCVSCQGYFLGEYVEDESGNKRSNVLLHFKTPDDIRVFIDLLSEMHFGVVCGEFDKSEIPKVFKQAFGE